MNKYDQGQWMDGGGVVWVWSVLGFQKGKNENYATYIYMQRYFKLK